MAPSPNKLTFWQEGNLDPLPLAGRLDSVVDVDVAIVGGGVAGLSTALNLAQLGHAPVVLEAGSIASAASGASAGIIAPQMSRGNPTSVRAKLGAEEAGKLLTMVAEAGNYLFELARAHAPDSDAEQAGFIAPVMGQRGLAKLRATAEAWRTYRSDVSILSADETRILTGVGGYAGALLDTSGGTINPLAFCRGLARAATAAGAAIHTDSRVISLSRQPDGWLISTAAGAVRTRRVVLCANVGNADLHPRLAGTTLPLEVCEVATQPLDARWRSIILPQRHALTDVEADIFTIRYNRDGGLVTAYPAGPNLDDDTITRAVNARLSATIEGWEPLPLTHVWRGQAAVNSSLLPRLVGVDEGLVAVQACNGRGLAINSILGRELAAWLHAPHKTAPPLALTKPKRVSGFLLAKHAPKLIISAALVAKRIQQFAASAFPRGAKAP